MATAFVWKESAKVPSLYAHISEEQTREMRYVQRRYFLAPPRNKLSTRTFRPALADLTWIGKVFPPLRSKRRQEELLCRVRSFLRRIEWKISAVRRPTSTRRKKLLLGAPQGWNSDDHPKMMFSLQLSSKSKVDFRIHPFPFSLSLSLSCSLIYRRVKNNWTFSFYSFYRFCRNKNIFCFFCGRH